MEEEKGGGKADVLKVRDERQQQQQQEVQMTEAIFSVKYGDRDR